MIFPPKIGGGSQIPQAGGGMSRGVQLPTFTYGQSNYSHHGAGASPAAPAAMPQTQQQQYQQPYEPPQQQDQGGGGYSPALQALQQQVGAPPQEAVVDPGIQKGLEPQGPTLFNFGQPAAANPALGHGNPAMEGLLRISRRRPSIY